MKVLLVLVRDIVLNSRVRPTSGLVISCIASSKTCERDHEAYKRLAGLTCLKSHQIIIVRLLCLGYT
jgi:hypothetical protein